MVGMSKSILETRLRSALWGIFAGDALAMPTHWFYGGLRQIQATYGSAGITEYTAPVYDLPGSILNKSNINGAGRSRAGDSGKKKNVNGGMSSIIGDVICHGKLELWAPNQAIHYHATLQRGECTLEAQLCRILMASMVKNHGAFDQNAFRKDYVTFMTTPDSHNDTYASTCHRMFFANKVFRGRPLDECPDNDAHNVDTLDGMVLPTIVALAYACQSERFSKKDGIEATILAAGATRKSDALEKTCAPWLRLITAALFVENDVAFDAEMVEFAKSMGLRAPNANPHGQDFLCACYLQHGMSTTLDLIASYPKDAEGCLLRNANSGGENVHRGALLGAICAAREDGGLAEKWRTGLHDYAQLSSEIDAFVACILK